MLINILNILIEASLYLLLFGITFSNSATEIFAISIVAFYVIKKILSRKFKPPRTPVNLILYVICTIVFITFLRSAYFSESIRGLLRVVKFIFLFFALAEFFTEDEERIKRTFWAIMIAAFFTFLNGVFQSIYGFDLLRHKGLMGEGSLRRIQASFVHPNDFGAYIIFVLPLTLCFLSRSIRKTGRVFLVLSCLLGAYCLLKTSSRAAWIGALIGVMVYLFIYKKKVLIIVPFVAALLLLVTSHGFERIVNLFAAEHNSVWERTQLWKGTWNMVKVHPFFGFGINTFSRYFPQYKPSVYWGIMYSHNSYLQMWSEIGIFGLLAYLALIFTILIKTLRGMHEKLKKGFEGFILLGSMAGYIAFLIQSGLDTNLYSLVLTTLFWVMNAYIMSVNKILEKEIASGTKVPSQ
jgi:putative inorganic carbon (hco3(-)) transporter